jgi:hypothetical protein
MNAPVIVDPRHDAYAIAIDQIDIGNPHLYQDDTWRPCSTSRSRNGAS